MFTDTKLARLLTLTHVNHSLILYNCGKRETYPLCDGCAGIVKEAIFNYGKFLENEEKILSARCENIALLQRFVSKFHKAKLEARRHCPWLEKQPQPDIKVVLSQ